MTKHLAIVFPGQGSQSVGMLSDIAAQYPDVQRVFAEASDALHYDLWQMTLDGPAELLDQTMHTQPALLAASYAVWQIIHGRKNLSPAIIAGHSLGEYTALVCAGSLAFSDAIKLVAARGNFMQEAVASGVGAMAAIVGLDNDEVEAICKLVAIETNEIVAPANFNSIGQVVVAGHKHAVELVAQQAKAQGAKLAVLLPVSVPSHCELMKPAAENLADMLKTIKIQEPTIPVVNNADVALYQSADSIRDGLIKQLYMPVRWVETVQYMQKQGVTRIVECGPGKVLTGLNKRIDKTLDLVATNDLPSIELCLKTEGSAE